jgi:lysophospholipase L1-like esterase
VLGSHGSTAPRSEPTSLWIGDSYTAGAGAASSATGEAYATSAVLHWHSAVDAEGGTGFVAVPDAAHPSPTVKAVPARLQYDKSLEPDPSVVVLDAGRNDVGYPWALVRRTVVSYCKALARTFPSAPVVVIAPFLMRSKPGDYGALRQLLGRESRRYGWAFVDPIAEGWVNAESAKLVGPDGVHPTQDGYNWIIAHLAPAITNALAAAHETVK